MDDTNYKEYRVQKYTRAIMSLHIHGLGGQAIKQIANALASDDLDACDEILHEIACLKQEKELISKRTACEILQELYDQDEAIDKGYILRLALRYGVIIDMEKGGSNK